MLSKRLVPCLGIAALACAEAFAAPVDSEPAPITAVTINTEWLWTPLDNSVDGSAFNRGDMSETAYWRELMHYAKLIVSLGANVVALQEIENESVAKDLSGLLGPRWQALFKQGRDTATGQDVALLSSLEYVEGSATHFGFPRGFLPGDPKGKSLSKLLGARFIHPADNRPFWVVTTHLLSRKNDNASKAKKRMKQVYSLIAAANGASIEGRLLLLGDFNSRPSDREVQVLVGSLGVSIASEACSRLGFSVSKSVNSSATEGFKKRRKGALVDHLLYRNLRCEDFGVLDLGGLF